MDRVPDAPLKTEFLQLSTRILNDLADGKSPQILGEAVCRFAENAMPGLFAVIMVEADGKLAVFAAPSTSVGRDSLAASSWSCPVWLDNHVVGTFALTGPTTSGPNLAARELLEFCSAMTGTVLRYAQLQDKALEQHAALSRAIQFNVMLAQANQVIADAEDVQALFKAVCEIAVQHGQMKLAFIGVPGADQHFRVLAAAGHTGYLDGLIISSNPALPEGQGSMGQAWRDGKVMYNQSFANTPHLGPWKLRASEAGFGASASLPILRQGAVMAVLSVYHAQENIFSADLRQVLEELSRNISHGLERIFLQRRLVHEQDKQRYLTIHDALTGLPNRLALDQHLPGALARARKDQTLLAVCLADLDDFKAINDAHGMEGGDRLLKVVAQRLRSALRDTDLVARSGGDEFVLVIEGLLRYEDLFPRLARIHELLSNEIELPDAHRVTVQISLGLTFYPNDGGDGDLLMRHAFEAMYGLKAHKGVRSSWWQIWGEGNLIASPAQVPSIEPYGAEAAALLAPLQDALFPLPHDFVETLHSDWLGRVTIATLLERLDPEDLAVQKARLERHILMLQRADLTEDQHRGFAEALGRVNTLVGFDLTALIEAIQAYQNQVGHRLHELQGMRLSEKQRVMDVIAGRLRVELQSQIRALQQLMVQRQSWLAEQSLRLSHATSWVDTCRELLESITELQGCIAATINRPDTTGKLVYEFKTAVLERYLNDLEAAGVVPHLVNVQDGQSLRPAHMRIWQTEQIETNASYATERHLSHLRKSAHDSEIRSAVFVPITDGQGRIAAALGVFGHHPGQFESAETQLFFQSIGHLLSQARQRLYRPNLVYQSSDQRRMFRRLLENGGLMMEYQPIVDLTTGKPTKIEALARLKMADGTLASPAIFLSGFGTRELVLLFQRGLDQALAHLSHLGQYPDLIVSLNLPPAVLVEAECAQWVEQALQRQGIPARRLELEVLEDAEFHDLEAARVTLVTLAAQGVHLVMDDLGAGYSSLLRLRHLPFSTVKIDQGLVREIAKDPERVIVFISGLVRLAKSLKLRVTEEGLESSELVEVASLLGADEGQGYALSRPLPAAALAPWLASFHWIVAHDNPVTPLGRLALQKRGY